MQESAALREYIHDQHFELIFLKSFSGIPGILIFQGLCYLPVQIGETCLNHDLPIIRVGKVNPIEDLMKGRFFIIGIWLVMQS